MFCTNITMFLFFSSNDVTIYLFFIFFFLLFLVMYLCWKFSFSMMMMITKTKNIIDLEQQQQTSRDIRIRMSMKWNEKNTVLDTIHTFIGRSYWNSIYDAHTCFTVFFFLQRKHFFTLFQFWIFFIIFLNLNFVFFSSRLIT